MATDTNTEAASDQAPFIDQAIWAIVSDDRGVESEHGAAALQASGTTVVLGILSTEEVKVGQDTIAAGAAAAAYNATFDPSMLWVSEPLQDGGPCYLYSYPTYASSAPRVLTATAQGSAINLAAPTHTSDGQLWHVRAPESDKHHGVPAARVIHAAQIQGAIRRTSAQPVKGSTIELGETHNEDSHLVSYRYQLVRVAPPAATPPAKAPAKTPASPKSGDS